MTGLTRRQLDCFNAIVKLTTPEGIAPTFDELMVELDCPHRNNIWRLMVCLEERGYIRRLKGQARAITVLRHPGSNGRVDAIMADIMATDTAAFIGERSQQVIRDCIARGLAQ